MRVTSLEIVNEAGQVVLMLDADGITFTADNGMKAVLKLRKGTDASSVKLIAQQMPLGTAAMTIIDNIT